MCPRFLQGIKLSNLLTVTKATKKMWKICSVIQNYCTYTLPDKTSYNIPAFFVKKLLLAYLNEEDVKETMRLFGYQTLRLIDIFEKLCARYQKYMKDHLSFPHELGLLLGYPVEDVLGLSETRDAITYIAVTGKYMEMWMRQE